MDFDFFTPPDAEDDVHLAWRQLQQNAPAIFWTPRNGGHWIATRADDIEAIQLDHERFSMKRILIPNVARPFPVPPLDVDPPEHAAFRILIAPIFSPRAVAELEDRIRRVTAGLVADLAARGGCEFMAAFAKVLPIVVFLGMMGLPEDDREKLLPFADAITRSKDPAVTTAARLAMAEYVSGWIARRRAMPGDDAISRITQAKVNGAPMSDEQVLGMCVVLLSAGLDTVASMLGFAARFLALNPAHRRQLVERPELIPAAVDELIRRHGLANMARLVTRDTSFGGVELKQGEQIQIPNALFGLDERRVSNPLEVDFERQPTPHAAFGNGPHRCPGANLARSELRIFLELWLAALPDFSLKPGSKPVLRSGTVNAVLELELVWPKAAGVA